MAIDPKLPIPVYFQLKTPLLEEILDGRYGPDGRLPTEHQLCERYGISRTPVTRALSELATEGVVIRHRRRGTFVNPHWLRGHRGGPELRVIVPEGPWEGLIRRAETAIVQLRTRHHDGEGVQHPCQGQGAFDQVGADQLVTGGCGVAGGVEQVGDGQHRTQPAG
jgi:DNA-binding GntR family transcriptional regulator